MQKKEDASPVSKQTGNTFILLKRNKRADAISSHDLTNASTCKTWNLLNLSGVKHAIVAACTAMGYERLLASALGGRFRPRYSTL